MKITFLQSSLWLSGGARVVVEYANRLSRRGHELSIVIPKNTLSYELAQELDGSVKICEAKIPLIKPISVLNQIRLAISMIQVTPVSDVIISTHTPTTIVSLIACYLLKRGVPTWLYQDYAEMFASRPLEAWLLRNAFRWQKGIFLISNYLAQELKGYDKKNCYYVGEGLSNKELLYPLSVDDVKDLKYEKFVILYLGDFRPRKGLSEFLEAIELVYKKNRDIEIWIALKERGEVKTKVPHRLIYNPTNEHLAELYRTCNLFVSASWAEGFGLPPLEAMACGAPVVMTDSGGVQDFALPEENCLLIPPRDPNRMAEAIYQMIENPELSMKFRRMGPLTAAQFSWEESVDRLENAIKKVFGS